MITRCDEKPNKRWSTCTVLIKIQRTGFSSLEKACLGLVNWSSGFSPKIKFEFLKNICCLWQA